MKILCFIALTSFELDNIGRYSSSATLDTTSLRTGASLEELPSNADCLIQSGNGDKRYSPTYLSSGCLICSKMKSKNVANGRKSNPVLSDAVSLDVDVNKNISDVSHAFTDIYEKSLWGQSGGGSGGGSDTAYAKMTGYLLELVMLRYGLDSMLDAPCGGVYDSWMAVATSRIRKSIPCFRYHGNIL